MKINYMNMILDLDHTNIYNTTHTGTNWYGLFCKIMQCFITRTSSYQFDNNICIIFAFKM